MPPECLDVQTAVTALGMIGLLLDAKRRGIVAEVKPVLDEMRASGFFLDEARYQSVLQRAGE